MAHTYSSQQQTIINWFQFPDTGKQNMVARSRAGVGKTTILVAGMTVAPEADKLVCAFSKIIEQELTKRFAGTNVVAKTLHGIGFSCVRRYRERLHIDASRADALALKVCGKNAPDSIVRLVSKLHTKGREIAPHATTLGHLTNIAIRHDCEPDEMWAASGFDLNYIERKALEAMEIASQVQSGEVIDFADMIFLPVRNGWMAPAYDIIAVDEAQDMTTSQLELALGVLRPGGRFAIFGDDRQAIFGFRGADSNSLDRLKLELNAVELPMTVTYRCATSIVEQAQRLVPDFTAGPANPEGAVTDLLYSELVASAQPGDFILSRTNAPLVPTAMALLKAGKRTRIAGRDISKTLLAVIRKLKARSVPDLLSKISAWESREVSRQEALLTAGATDSRRRTVESKIETLRDQASMLSELCEGAESIAAVEKRMETLFSDDERGVAGFITCSSVHRSKGLEADRVFILTDTLKENAEEERNIVYVAVTRAKRELYYVRKEQKQ
jgi:superfamily I DNA/RNA helicase